MGSNLNRLANANWPESPTLHTKVIASFASSVSSRTGHSGLSPLFEEDEEESLDDEDKRRDLFWPETLSPSLPSSGTR